jgi:hypothetical protein
MKLAFMIIGGVIGTLVAGPLFGGFWRYVGAFLGSLAGMSVPSLVRYIRGFLRDNKADCSSVLEFHAGDDFTSWATRETEALRDRMASLGLLRLCNDQYFYCTVEPNAWDKLSDSRRLTFCMLCHRACINLMGDDIMGKFTVHAHSPDYMTSR